MKLTRHPFLSYKNTSVKIKRVVYFMKIRNTYDSKDIVEIVKCQPEKRGISANHIYTKASGHKI